MRLVIYEVVMLKQTAIKEIPTLGKSHPENLSICQVCRPNVIISINMSLNRYPLTYDNILEKYFSNTK